jgi:hypothetical protein
MGPIASNVAAAGHIAVAREMLTGRIPTTANVNLILSLRAQADLVSGAAARRAAAFHD